MNRLFVVLHTNGKDGSLRRRIHFVDHTQPFCVMYLYLAHKVPLGESRSGLTDGNADLLEINPDVPWSERTSFVVQLQQDLERLISR